MATRPGLTHGEGGAPGALGTAVMASMKPCCLTESALLEPRETTGDDRRLLLLLVLLPLLLVTGVVAVVEVVVVALRLELEGLFVRVVDVAAEVVVVVVGAAAAAAVAAFRINDATSILAARLRAVLWKPSRVSSTACELSSNETHCSSPHLLDHMSGVQPKRSFSFATEASCSRSTHAPQTLPQKQQ